LLLIFVCLIMQWTNFDSSLYKKLPYSGSSSLARTLKEHLYQCPSKTSEEMVRCMASIYYLLRTEGSEKTEKPRSPFLSRSSTNVILPRRVNGEENGSLKNKCIVEVSSISADKNQMPDVSYAITHYRLVQNRLLQNIPPNCQSDVINGFFSSILGCLWNSLKELT
jgi:hypothetical protein